MPSFRVWAPLVERVDLHVVAPFDKVVPMDRGDDGYFTCDVEGAERYLFRLNDRHERADPASRFQPEGVFGPSQVWERRDVPSWNGRALDEYVIYEAHIGTLTREGTFASAVTVLDALVDLGFTALEVMPVAQFPGARNWGYDGVFPYAAQSTYGGPDGLALLVGECHKRGLAVILDVVYNHFGPEGCYVQEFAPFFTDRYRTPWGSAIDFSQRGVRDFFIKSALYWFESFDVDAFRLDAVDQIFDDSPVHFLQELADEVGKLDRKRYLIAEHERLEPRLDGYGIDAQWFDGFHHSLVAHVTGERDGYFKDFGDISHIAKAFEADAKCVVFSANHDQIGNRMTGDRLSTRVSLDENKLVAAAVLLSPFIPLVFMGEEYGETNPFQYFVDHSSQKLLDAVRRGRRNEFKSFRWEGEPPDPAAVETFERSKLDPSHGNEEVRSFYRGVIELRRTLEGPARAEVDGGRLIVRRGDATIVFDFSSKTFEVQR